MTVELISVGTEILLGNIVNTNAAYLSEKCAELGLTCFYQSVVGDNEERLATTIKTAMKRSDIIILGGGLGPTEDDLTKEVATKVCGKRMYLDERSKDRIKAYFAQLGKEPTESNWKQAMIPEGAKVLDNNNGTAPGVIIETSRNRLILLPGPPGEMRPMFEESVIPYLKTLAPGVIVSQTVKICNIGESKAEDMVKDLIDTQTNPTIATYAKTGEVHIRVTASASDEKAAKTLIKPMVKELKTRFGDNVYTTDESVSLEKAVVDLLLANDLKITVAESCTGGALSARLVSVPGVSEVYKEGFITYSNKAKRKVLGVKKKLLKEFTAVSAPVAEAMARGALGEAKADVAISVTGVAGPGPDEDGNPAGLVYIGVAVGDIVTVEEYHIPGGREKVRESAVSRALTQARNCILQYGGKGGEE